MGLFGSDREKNEGGDHKWAYINLSDFRSHSCWTPFTYVVLYISLLISIACYAIDIFTCSQLLLFDKWSGQIQPVVPLEIARWVFTGCILLSLVLLVYRWIRAIRVIKTESIAKSYLDPLAVRLQSIRMGQNGKGWRRFLLFAELTKLGICRAFRVLLLRSLTTHNLSRGPSASNQRNDFSIGHAITNHPRW